MDVTNEQLIYGAGTGDAERFRLIVERYSNAVYAQVYSKVGDFHLAQDLTQEVFLKAHLHLTQLKEAGKIGAWLLAIANRVAIDWLRANGDRRFLENTVEVSNLLVEDSLAQTNAQDFIWEALSQLDEGSRTIVIMQMNGYRLEEIGTFLDLSDKAVDSRLRRAKQKLKKELVATMEQGIQRHKLGDAFVQKVVGTVLFPKDLFFPNDNMASAVMEKVKEAFRELYPHISMDTRTVANYTDKLRKYIAEGMPPDIILLGNDDYPEYDRRGWMLDLRPYLEADGVDLDDFVGPSLDISTVNGRILGIPMTVATTAVFYNKSWFDEAQLPYPQGEWTWEEFADIAAKLQEKHGDPKQWRYGASVLYHTNILEMIVLSKGGRFISPDGRTIRGYLDSEETISALEWVADHIHQHQTFAPMIDYGFRRLFGEGRMGLIVDYTDAFPGLLNKMGEGFGIAALPRFKEGKRINVAASGGLGITAAARNPDTAWAFIREMLLKRGAMSEAYANIEIGNTHSLLRQLGHDKDERRSVFVKELSHAVSSARNSGLLWDVYYKQRINNRLNSIVTRKADVRETVVWAVEAIERDLEMMCRLRGE